MAHHALSRRSLAGFVEQGTDTVAETTQVVRNDRLDDDDLDMAVVVHEDLAHALDATPVNGMRSSVSGPSRFESSPISSSRLAIASTVMSSVVQVSPVCRT